MKTKLNIKSLVCGGLLGAIVMFSVAATTGTSPTKWEYRVVSGYTKPGVGGGPQLEPTLKSAGDEGWEAVSWTQADNSPPYYNVLLKRAK